MEVCLFLVIDWIVSNDRCWFIHSSVFGFNGCLLGEFLSEPGGNLIGRPQPIPSTTAFLPPPPQFCPGLLLPGGLVRWVSLGEESSTDSYMMSWAPEPQGKEAALEKVATVMTGQRPSLAKALFLLESGLWRKEVWMGGQEWAGAEWRGPLMFSLLVT